MKRLIIAIDVSLESTGVCFRLDGKSRYLNILNQYHFSTNKKFEPVDVVANNEVLFSITKANNLKIEFIQRVASAMPTKATEKKKGITLSEWGRAHMSNSLQYSSLIVQSIDDFLLHQMQIDAKNHKDSISVVIENYSYGSETSQLIQLAEFTSLIKQKLLNKFLLLHNLHLATSPEVKMFVGNGNYDKYNLFQHFLANTMKDEHLPDDSLWGILSKDSKKYWEAKIKKKYGKLNKKTGEKPLLSQKEINLMLTPVGDIIDSYFIALYAERKFGLD